MFAVNVGGVYNCCRAVLPTMIHHKSGRIVNVSSIWGITGASCEVHYSAAKAAVIGFTKALAKEVAPSGITVNCVAPGAIDTDMNRNISPQDMADFCLDIPMGRMGTAEEAAHAIAFFASDRASYITGEVLSPAGGYGF